MKTEVITSALVSALLLTAIAPARAEKVPAAQRVAEAHGIANWSRVREIAYTFNVEAGERRTRREWKWWPQEGRVQYVGGTRPDTTVTYLLGDITDDAPRALRRIDHAFINDQYWLLIPFHLVWDADVTVTDDGAAPLPIGEGSAHKVTAHYGAVGGYTPGDTYELFVDDSNHIVQWNYISSEDPNDRSATTFEDLRDFGGIRIPMEHRDGDRTFRLFFTDVRIEFDPR